MLDLGESGFLSWGIHLVTPYFPVGARDQSETLPLRRIDRAFTGYERFRLELYRARPGNPNRIEFRALGEAWASRFPAVGYFNQVQRATAADLAHLGEFEAFYDGIASGYKVQVAPETDRVLAFSRLSAAGFGVRETTVRLMLERPRPAGLPRPVGLEIAPVRAAEVDDFFRTYLECFGAARAGWAAAVENMRCLAGRPEMHCLFARMHGRPAGIGMLYIADGTANFCAGGVLTPWRNSGLHAALIDARLRLAAEAGCDLAIGWSAEGGPGHRSLARAGFRLAYRDPVWHPRSGPTAPGGP